MHLVGTVTEEKRKRLTRKHPWKKRKQKMKPKKRTPAQVTPAGQMHLVGTVTEAHSCAPVTLDSPTETPTISASSASTTATVQEIALVLKISVLDHQLRVLRVLSRLVRNGTG